MRQYIVGSLLLMTLGCANGDLPRFAERAVKRNETYVLDDLHLEIAEFRPVRAWARGRERLRVDLAFKVQNKLEMGTSTFLRLGKAKFLYHEKAYEVDLYRLDSPYDGIQARADYPSFNGFISGGETRILQYDTYLDDLPAVGSEIDIAVEVHSIGTKPGRRTWRARAKVETLSEAIGLTVPIR